MEYNGWNQAQPSHSGARLHSWVSQVGNQQEASCEVPHCPALLHGALYTLERCGESALWDQQVRSATFSVMTRKVLWTESRIADREVSEPLLSTGH